MHIAIKRDISDKTQEINLRHERNISHYVDVIAFTGLGSKSILLEYNHLGGRKQESISSYLWTHLLQNICNMLIMYRFTISVHIKVSILFIKSISWKERFLLQK